MKELLIQTLSTFGYPVFLHGTLGADEPFPASFFTFMTTDSPDEYPFDDVPTHTGWEYNVIFYSNSPETVTDIATQSREAMRSAGIIPQGKGHDYPSEEATHTAWMISYKFLAEY